MSKKRIKFALYIGLAIFSLSPAPSLAQDSAYDRHPEWFQCKSDDECVSKCESCGDVAMNKNYSSHSAEVVPACLSNLGCAAGRGMIAIAKCEKNKCVIQFQKDTK